MNSSYASIDSVSSIYYLSLDASQLSTYGSVSSSSENAMFTCQDGCPLVITNQGYEKIWWTLVYDPRSSVPDPPYSRFWDLKNGTSVYSLDDVLQREVDWYNQSRQYQWMLIDGDTNSSIATSTLFRIQINEWDYASGSPKASATGVSNLVTSPKLTLSDGAIAGIILGGAAFIAALIFAFFFVRERMRRRQSESPITHLYEKVIGKPFGKLEEVETIKVNPSKGSPSEGTGPV